MESQSQVGMRGYLYKIHRKSQLGLPTTTQLQHLSSLTIQQSPSTGESGNLTLSLAFVSSVSDGSGTALPITQYFSPYLQHVLMTLIDPSQLREQSANVFVQPSWKGAGIDACQYHIPRYRVRLTQSTVSGGSKGIFTSEPHRFLREWVICTAVSCTANVTKTKRYSLFIYLFDYKYYQQQPFIQKGYWIFLARIMLQYLCQHTKLIFIQNRS